MKVNKEHKCEICETVYSSKHKLKNHFIAVHDKKGKIYKCNICSKSFQTQQTLLVHVKSVHGQKRPHIQNSYYVY